MKPTIGIFFNARSLVLGLLFLSSPAFAGHESSGGELIPPSIICERNQVTVVLRDFANSEKGGMTLTTANLILTENDETLPEIPVNGLENIQPNLPVMQLVSSDAKTVIQVITKANGEMTANFSSKDLNLRFEGENALQCQDHRKPPRTVKPGQL